MIECSTFQETLTDYIEGMVCPEVRVSCALHRLNCRQCHDLYDQVKSSMRLLQMVRLEEPSPSSTLAGRIIDATCQGEMSGCAAFDHLISQYFDGVILAPDYQEFQRHFEACEKCRFLLAGIEVAIENCQRLGEVEVDVPAGLARRILTATIGNVGLGIELDRRIAMAARCLPRSIDLGRVAAASLIIAASVLLIVTRFDSLDGIATEADLVVSRGQVRVLRTGYEARESLGVITSSMNRIFTDLPQPGQTGRPSRPERMAPSPEAGKNVVTSDRPPREE